MADCALISVASRALTAAGVAGGIGGIDSLMGAGVTDSALAAAFGAKKFALITSDSDNDEMENRVTGRGLMVAGVSREYFLAINIGYCILCFVVKDHAVLIGPEQGIKTMLAPCCSIRRCTVSIKHPVNVFLAFFLLASSMQAGWSSPDSKIANESRFREKLLEIAAEYQNYGKVDDMARWAPWLCSLPLPPKARLSASTDGGTHGRKVYYLFAKNRDAYMKKEPSPTGQVVVKESWMPNLDSAGKAIAGGAKPTEKRDLFIMYKLDAKTPGTDQGWVYGTTTADGKTVTSVGRVQSCMSCHIQTDNDRLFGLKKD